MKRQIKILLVSLALICNFPVGVLAGDSIGFSVSCTIPAIPGVNAPLEEKAEIQPQIAEEKETQNPLADAVDQEEQSEFIEELQETQLAKEASPTLTKVIYSR